MQNSSLDFCRKLFSSLANHVLVSLLNFFSVFHNYFSSFPENHSGYFHNTFQYFCKTYFSSFAEPLTVLFWIISQYFCVTPSSIFKNSFKGALVQIWKYVYMFLFIYKYYPENFAFLILRILELCTHKVFEVYVKK